LGGLGEEGRGREEAEDAEGEEGWVRFAPARENVARCGFLWRGVARVE
jgi:hypothetical protein